MKNFEIKHSETMAIGLIDVDSTLPDLALMKLSAYHKSLGEEVEFVQKNKKYEIGNAKYL